METSNSKHWNLSILTQTI